MYVCNVYVCNITCWAFFICLGGICVHVLMDAMSHVVFCVSYVLYMFMCGVVLCGIYVFLRTVCLMWYLSFLALTILTLKICENGLLGSLEKPFHPVTGISMSHGERMHGVTEPQALV